MVRRMTNWGVTKTNNDRNLLRYSHTYSNGWFTYHGFCHNNNIFQNKWVWILVVTVPYILDSDVGKVNQRQKRNTRPFITLQFLTDLQASAIRQIPEIYLKSTKRKISPDFPPIFRPCIELWSISRSKPLWSRIQMWSYFFRIGNILESFSSDR